MCKLSSIHYTTEWFYLFYKVKHEFMVVCTPVLLNTLKAAFYVTLLKQPFM